MTEQLNPCPFCSGTRIVVDVVSEDGHIAAYCDVCKATGPLIECEQFEEPDQQARTEAVWRWNWRTVVVK